MTFKSLVLDKGRKYFINSGWLVFEKIGRGVLALAVGVYLARYLGPDQFGLLNYAISIVSFLTIFANLGMDNIIVREIVRDDPEHSEVVVMGSSFAVKLVLSFLLFLLFLLFSWFYYDEQKRLVMLFCALAIIPQSFNVLDFFFQAKLQAQQVVKANLISVIVSSGLKVLAIWLGCSLVQITQVMAIEAFLMALGLIFFYRSSGGRFGTWQINSQSAKRLVKDSFPMLLSSLAIIVFMRTDQIMINHMLTSADVGFFSVAVKLSETFYFIPMVLGASFFPAVIKASKASPELYRARLQIFYDAMVWLAMLFIVPMFLMSTYLVPLLYGPAYQMSVAILQIHVWSSIFVFLGVANSQWFLVEDKQVYSSYITIISALINIGLNFFMIKHYGVLGAAISTLISMGFASVVGLAFFPACRDNLRLSLSALNLWQSFKRLYAVAKAGALP